MDREFLDLYNRELSFLYELGAEFAEQYPGIASRLGGLLREHADPVAAGLLEGSAFLAARIQLKLKHEFPEFTANLLEQLVPHYLAPTPSAMLVKIQPPFGDAALREGHSIGRGALLDAAWLDRDRQIACRYSLTSDVKLFPFDITGADYFQTPGALHALGVPAGSDVAAGLRLTLRHRSTGKAEDEPDDKQARKMPECWLSGCRISDLPIHLIGAEADCDALCEQIIGHRVGVWYRHLDEFGNPIALAAGPEPIEQLGFGEDESLLPSDNRVFEGFDLLREYFMFPRKFLGFRLLHLDTIFPKVASRSVDLVIGFNEVNARLAAAVEARMFALFAAPAVNLFEMTADRILVKKSQHEYQVVPDRSRYLEFESHRILQVHAHYPGGGDKVPVSPLYARDADGGSGLAYTVRRLPRRRTIEEQRHGSSASYIGTDMFLSLGEPAGLDDDHAVAELSVRALCSNRHLTENIPVGQSASDFFLVEDVLLEVQCIAGPTPPREPVARSLRSRSENEHTGVILWRIVNMLRLNHLGLVGRGAGDNARALREILAMFADMADSAVERRIRGIKAVDSRPIVRRIRQQTGIAAARGLEISVTIEDQAFQGIGRFLLGAVLDRFFAQYAAFNHFTQLVMRTADRGEITRWPPRIGKRGAL